MCHLTNQQCDKRHESTARFVSGFTLYELSLGGVKTFENLGVSGGKPCLVSFRKQSHFHLRSDIVKIYF